MPTRSKFTADRREAILVHVRAGVPLRTAAALVGVDGATLFRWLARGRDAGPGSLFRQFVADVEQARAQADADVVHIVRRALPDNPSLAWKWIERRLRADFGPEPPPAPVRDGPVVISLALPTGRPPLYEVPSPRALESPEEDQPA